jgi:hypothetical protein
MLYSPLQNALFSFPLDGGGIRGFGKSGGICTPRNIPGSGFNLCLLYYNEPCSLFTVYLQFV